MISKRIICSLTILLMIQQANAAHLYPEKEYQHHWCVLNNGLTEVRLQDKTRVDCLTSKYAIEFDFANKWAESVGQSLYYAICTGKMAGVVLIMENGDNDLKYLKRLKEIATKYNIKVWTITPEEIPISKNCGNKNN